ncbi:endo-1,4-beta-xylanase [Rhabdaerophilum calidifontis]|uniref:endo-1,4-beta-xylanase n=1 Tax=Rhabdaerophilum calidifontis TaxID=2604328 RepID=UPI00140A7A92|nr:endo-1,4-beta-xylanase [Rhabdaerophilum calidifontis]
MHVPRKGSGPDRRQVLAGLGALSAMPARAQPLPLWAAAASRGLVFGASSSWEVIRDPDYAALHARESRLMVTDKAMKFDFLRPRADVYDFAEADALLAFAREHGMAFRGHTLIWNYAPPPWLAGKSSAEIERIFDDHLETVAGRYAGAMESWDVVNEPFWPDHGAPGGFRRGPWFDAMGEGYIERAFRRVATIDRSATLVLNEAFCEQNDRLGIAVRARMLPLIDRLLDRGVKLDAIGLQAHLKPGLPFEIDAFLRFLDEIAARGLPIYLSEFDIDDESFPRESAKRDALVAEWGARFLGPVLANRAVRAIITWHLSDKYTWYREPQVARRRQRDFAARPLPFDDRMAAKPLRSAMAEAFRAAPAR